MTHLLEVQGHKVFVPLSVRAFEKEILVEDDQRLNGIRVLQNCGVNEK